MKVYILTFGCKVNQYESSVIYRLFCDLGHIRSSGIKDADIIIFNSCAVTSESGRKLRQAIHKSRKINKNFISIVTGCIPQAFPGEMDIFENIDIVLGNFNKNKIYTYLNNFLNDPKRTKIRVIQSHPNHLTENLTFGFCTEHTRAFLKIQDGCNRYCSYCIIPYARGNIRSKPIYQIQCEAEELARNGFKEIVLVGINLSSYGIDIGSTLVHAVATLYKIEGIKRIRLGSLEPDMLNDDMLEKLLEFGDKLCPHFHLSLQSGSDKILKSMRRLYSRKDYIELVKKIRDIFEFPEITTDLMVGFPGESEEDFNESIKIISDVGFLKVHVFPYSQRHGTLAAKMPDQVPKTIKNLRVKLTIDEAKKQSKVIFNKYINKCVYVLYENRKNGNIFEGYTNNYIPVISESFVDISGKILLTQIKESEEGFCVGSIVQY